MPEARISFLLNNLVKEMNSQADGLLRREFDITYSQFVFLLNIAENGTLDVTRLAQAMGVTKGAVSKRLPWFLARGLVNISHPASNAKQVLVTLTTTGEKLAASAGNFLEISFLKAISQAPELNQDTLKSEVQKMLDLLAAKNL